MLQLLPGCRTMSAFAPGEEFWGAARALKELRAPSFQYETFSASKGLTAEPSNEKELTQPGYFVQGRDSTPATRSQLPPALQQLLKPEGGEADLAVRDDRQLVATALGGALFMLR